MQCIKCNQIVILTPDKPGRINECYDCGRKSEIPRVGGNMIWSHKTAPDLEIKSMKEAKVFAKQQKRFGAGPLRSIVTSREPSTKEIGANPGDQIISPLGEKHSVKR